jgi:endonuclease/exonuclease/phosphatase family metal-dependent hydrolase
MNKIAFVTIFFGVLVLLAALSLGIFLLWMNANEYKPEKLETVQISRNPSAKPVFNQAIELYSWNIGYASLDASQDFFMDGGKGVRPSTDSNVETNVWAIQAFFSGNAPDIVFLQEVDRDSKRSYNVDEAGYFSETWKGSSAYATNYRSKFVPYPLFRFIGKVESGLLTLNSYSAVSAERAALPSAFDWPERLGQLKRCLLVERVPLQDGGQLVLVNVHLEAYNSGIRTAQTKEFALFCRAEYEKGNYVVAGGDFNQTFPGLENAFPLLTKANFSPQPLDPSPSAKREGSPPDPKLFDSPDGSPTGWIFAADPSVPSSRLLNKPYEKDGDNQFYLIDGFVLSPNVTLISVETIDLDFKNSDHNPVKLTFSLPSP